MSAVVNGTITDILALIGAAFVLLAGIGTLRFGDLYGRMHAATKATTLGFALVALAAASGLEHGRAKVLLVVVFVFITSPAVAHFVGRAAYRAEGVDIELEGPDDLHIIIDEHDKPGGQ
ncbi:MAG: monovalent cation/H(+) antiporter subunit G [Acidimicrobiales bacterium]|nr:monovalent cation/H(+) antiporter subunit G [Acidimicrobiales bacterium]